MEYMAKFYQRTKKHSAHKNNHVPSSRQGAKREKKTVYDERYIEGTYGTYSFQLYNVEKVAIAVENISVLEFNLI